MRIAIISDTHFGDDHCALVYEEGGTLMKGVKYDAFQSAIGPKCDYLVLLGDILDFSIASYEKAYRIAQFFFQIIKEKDIAAELVYVAGNHDADIWHIIQHQRAVINRLKKGVLPVSFEHSVAGVVDDRQKAPKRQLLLDKITPRDQPDFPPYGGMFLDHITQPETNFNFAYPNLYVVSDNETVLLTHGQYLEPFWSILGETANRIAYDDLKVGEVDIEEMVEMNFPLNQLACTGIGQAGVLTRVARMVEVEVKAGNLARVKKYLDRLEKEIDHLTDYGWLKELIVDFLLRKVKKEFLETLEEVEQTRYSEEFLYQKAVRARFKRFYAACLQELGAINADEPFNQSGLGIPAPTRVIFGHTHQPIGWNDPNPPKLETVGSDAPRRLTLHNTGGWLTQGDKFCGAEVFIYETGKGFSSVAVR